MYYIIYYISYIIYHISYIIYYILYIMYYVLCIMYYILYIIYYILYIIYLREILGITTTYIHRANTNEEVFRRANLHIAANHHGTKIKPI